MVANISSITSTLEKTDTAVKNLSAATQDGKETLQKSNAVTTKIIEESGYEGWVLVEAEQDPAKANPLEYAIKARKYIREKTGL